MEKRLLAWIERLCLVAVAIVGVRIILALSGLVRPVNQKLPDLEAPMLFGPVLLHAAYGLGLCALVIGCGSAVLALIRARLPLSDGDTFVFAVPAGLAIVLVGAVFHAFGVIGSTLILSGLAAVAVVGIVNSWPSARSLRLLSSRSLIVVFLALAYGMFMGLYWRTGTSQWIGTVDLGDLSIYTGWYHTLRHGMIPFANLGVEGETISTYFNQAPTLLALLAGGLPAFDPALFLATSLITFFICALCFTMRGVCVGRGTDEPLPLSLLALIVGLLVASNGRPSWTVESPPAVLLYPLIPAVAYAVHRAEGSPLRLVLCVVFAGVISIGSKVVSLVVLGTYSGLALVTRLREGVTFRQSLAIGVVAVLLGGYIAIMAWQFLPSYFSYWSLGPESLYEIHAVGWRKWTRAWSEIARDIALIPLVVGAYLTGGIALGGAVAVGEMALLFHWQLFSRTSQISAFVLVATSLIFVGRKERRAVPWIAAAIGLSLPFSFDRDPGGWTMELAWILVSAPAFWLALEIRTEPSKQWMRQRLDRAIRRISLAVLALTIVALPALAAGEFRIGEKRRTITPPALAELWEQTRSLTQEGALVFTDQTGNEASRLSGWNDFALSAERQFYVVTWASSRLRQDEAARQRQLAINDAVLKGKCSPADLQLSRAYDGYYAAVASTTAVPDHFEVVFRNAGYALYRIPVDPNAGRPDTCGAVKG